MEVKERKSYLFDFLNSISFNKDNLLDSLEEKEYNAYMINRYLSFEPDTLMYAQEMNQRYYLPQMIQFDFLRFGIRKKKRFFKYIKKEKEENINIVKEYYGYSNKTAREALEILSEDELAYMQSRMEKGGKKGKKDVE